MEWHDLSSIVGKAAPILGTLIAGPAGAAVGGLVASALGIAPATPDTVAQALTVNPDAAVKLAEIEAKKSVELQSLLIQGEQNRLANDTATIQAVNNTIQIEAKADHWPTYTWRPFIGFMFGLYVASLFILPLFKIKPEILTTDMVAAVGAILGVASWFRGKMQADPKVQTDNRG